MSSAGIDSGIIGWANKRLEHWSSTGIAVLAAIAGLLAAAIVVVGYWVFLTYLGNGTANYVLQFAGTSERLASRSAEFTLSEARGAQLWGYAFAVVWAAVGYFLFAVFWKHCWNAGPAAADGVVSGIRYLPVAGGLLSVVERTVTLATLRGGTDAAGNETVEMLWGAPAIVVTLAWGKWVIGGITVAAVLGMIVSACARAAQTPLPPDWADAFRAPVAKVAAAFDAGADDEAVIDLVKGEAPHAPMHDVGDLHQNKIREIKLSYGPSQAATAEERAEVTPDQEPMPLPEGTGISCSGGGIRAASFALGCLSRLERTPTGKPLPDTVIGRAKFLSSVSGGGYAAAAWRMAAGPGELPAKPIIGDPCHFEPSVHPFPHPDRPTPDLLTHIRERRSFLANGRGGLPRSIVRVILQMMLHLALIFMTVYVFAWPFGKLLGSWAVRALDMDLLATNADGEIRLESITGAHHWLPPVLTLAALGPLVLARMFMERNPARRIVDQVMAGLVFLAAGSAFVLLLLPLLVEFVVEVVPAGTDRLVFTGIWATIVTAVWQMAKRFVRRFIKYLGGVFLALGLAAFGAFVIDWSLRETTLGQWQIFLGLTIFLIIGFIVFNPDAWSLHDFYRQRLNGTFSTSRSDDGLWAQPDPPPMSDYIGVEPSPIICCAAARPPQADTGIAALSMTFEPQAVTIYHWERPEDSQLAELSAAQIPHAEFSALLPRGSQRLDSLMGAAAISGAAVAPSMGRKNFSTTNALLAAFNARLGVWVPNPAYGGPERNLDRKVAPRLVNMFKEIFGVYDPKDPNVYATDGGHWDNLGVVELIRRRCATIIAIDTSGDLLGTYNALKEAIALARHECGAEIDFGDEWEKLVPAEDGIVEHNHMLGTVRYRDGHTATILYVKGAVARTSSLAVQRYAAGDRTFPNYSTGNQMLTDRQLTFLVRLGDEAMATALDENPSVVTDALAPRIHERNEVGDRVGPGRVPV